MGGGASSTARTDGPSDLAGTWIPVRHNEWYNRNPGKHRVRAQNPITKVTYNTSGKGEGQVGEYHVTYSTVSLAPGQWSATATVPGTLWKAEDGNLTLLPDGTLEVRYPSNGIVEFWQREDGTGPELARRLAGGNAVTTSGRHIYLVFRKVLGKTALPYHWGIAIEKNQGSGPRKPDIYEVNGLMAIYGPEGIIAYTGPGAGPLCGTKLSQFEAILDLNLGVSTKLGTLPAGAAKTQKTHNEIVSFSQQWVNNHPVYKAEGPNCQTFAEDLFTFLTGQNLPYTKVGDVLGGSAKGPEADERTQWLK